MGNLHIISLAVAVISGVLLFWRGLHLRMVQRYPLVYAYIAITLFVECLGEMLARWLGPSFAYTALYPWLLLAHAAAGGAVVCRVYFLHRKPALLDLHFLGFAALILTRPFFWADDVWISYRLLTAAQMTLTYLGIAAFARLFFGGRIIFSLGWNLLTTLMAVILPSAFQSFIVTYYLFGARFSESFARTGSDLTAIATWLILVVGLWEYSPPSGLKQLPQRMRKKAQARIWANIKTLWGLR